MPAVSRLAGNDDTREGFLVETESSGDTYRYYFRYTGDDTVSLDRKTVNGEERDPEPTKTAVDAVEERGVEVVQ